MSHYKNSIRRICMTYSLIQRYPYIDIQGLMKKLYIATDEEYCRSSVEKTLITLRTDFDVEIGFCYRRKGYYLINPHSNSFLYCLFEYLKISDIDVVSSWISSNDLPH